MPVSLRVVGVERVHGAGRLVGLAIVQVDVCGVELTFQGVQVVQEAGGLGVKAPCFRHPRYNRSVPSVMLPDELRDAIGAEVLAVFGASG